MLGCSSDKVTMDSNFNVIKQVSTMAILLVGIMRIGASIISSVGRTTGRVADALILLKKF
jgi:hypothetical protein